MPEPDLPAMPEPDLLEGLLTRHEAARALRCHPRTLDNYRRRPDGLPSVNIAGRTYIPAAAIRAWIDARMRWPNPIRGVRRA